MRRFGMIFFAFLFVGMLVGVAQASDTLEMVKKKGILIGGVKDSMPGFGYIDERTHELVGYDVDFLKYIAMKLGVKLELRPVTSATRMPQLVAGNIDIIAATMAKTPERAKQVDLSYIYFYTGQKFITFKKDKIKKLADLNGKKIGTLRGSTSELNAKKALPNEAFISFNDYPQAFLALRQGDVAAITNDEIMLAKILAKAPDKDRYEIADIQISDEPYSLGIRKDDTKFLHFVNATLLEMEKNGEAVKIFNKWFGPKTDFPIRRNFKITDQKLSWEK
jgi:polar amino acid transport system substrate-binding protein